MAEINLNDALGMLTPALRGVMMLTLIIANIDSNLANTRKEGLADLKHVLGHNQKNPRLRTLGDGSFHRIFETLFRATLKERSNLLQAKTQTTRTSCANKLSAIASALRQAVESGARTLKLKTVKAVLDHVVDTVHYSSGGFCEPIALDYVRCLRALFEYLAHVEHLSDEWARIAAFCVDCIKQVDAETPTENGFPELSSTASMGRGSTFQSSRSTQKDSPGSQGALSSLKLVGEEAVVCLRLLTAAPNAPIHEKAADILWTLLEHLQRSAHAARSQSDALKTINQIIMWSRTDDIALTQQATGYVLRLVRQSWASKSSATEDMLVALLLLRPYLKRASGDQSAIAFQSDLEGVSQIIQEDYSKRQERDMLDLDDIRFEINNDANAHPGKVATPLLTLTSPRARANVEANWLLAYVLASIYDMLMASSQNHTQDSMSEKVIADSSTSRPRKRFRADDKFTALLSATAADTPQVRVCALQILTFLTQQKALGVSALKDAIEALTTSCNDESSSIASWSYLAMAGCAMQVSATTPSLSTIWLSVWQLASRAISNASSCRAASYALYIMLEAGLVPLTSTLDLVRTVTNRMDLSGPCLISDSVSLLLRGILRSAGQSQTGQYVAAAESIATWLCRHFTPSKVDDKSYVATATSHDPPDVSQLVFVCLGRQGHAAPGCRSHVWHIPARAWLLCEDNEALVTYLLLSPREQVTINPSLGADALLESSAATGPSVIAGESVLLSHFVHDLARTNEAWTATGPEFSLDSFIVLCKATCVAICTANCVSYKDSTRQLQLQHQAATLLKSLREFVSTARCDDDRADAFMSIISTTLHSRRAHHEAEVPRIPRCEVLLCRAVADASGCRQSAKMQLHMEDPMDLDEYFDSQESNHKETPPDAAEFESEAHMLYSRTALRSGMALYATAIVAVSNASTMNPRNQESRNASLHVADYILSQTDSWLLASRDIITALPAVGLTFQASDVARILEYLSGHLTKKYTYKRSEILLTTICAVMRSLKGTWMDRSNESVYDLGLDLYDWLTGVVLSGVAISINVQRQLTWLILDICETEAGYAGGGEVPLKDNLLGLIQRKSIIVQFDLAGNIPRFFGYFATSGHDKLLDEIQACLPKEIGWSEGIAMRLLFFSNIASMWNSLLRRCVYYMFESAGRLASSVSHATYCITKLAKALPIASPRNLFTLFAPQLLFTWLDNQPLSALPYKAFNYQSLSDLLTMNQSEICAQLVMRGSKEGLETMVKAVRMMLKDLVKHSFAKCCAYAISHDTVVTPSDPTAMSCTQRLRDLLGKEEYTDLIQKRLPTVIGYIFLSTQQEDLHGAWLQKRDGYGTAYQVLVKIKGYCHSQQALPQPQQPSFRSKYLCDQIERACRRAGVVTEHLWSPPAFTLVSRMLFDAVNASLGSLHSCLMIRRLRLLICLAGEVACKGIALEMLIHSLRPFVSDSECADDTLGILQYLLHQGQIELKSNPSFLTGTVVLLVVRLRKFVGANQENPAANGYLSTTAHNMLAFQEWLVAYYAESIDGASTPRRTALTQALKRLQLPGNARQGSPESSLLLFLLDQWSSTQPLCSKSAIVEALEALSIGFEQPQSIAEDCLGEDADSVRYSQALWEILCDTELTESFTIWAAQVIGRAYASSGIRPSKSMDSCALKIAARDGIAASQAVIAKQWLTVLFSRSRFETGLAEHTLRVMWSTQNEDVEEAAAFDHLLPTNAYDAFGNGAFGYEPAAVAQSNQHIADDQDLRQALSHEDADTVSFDSWVRRLAVTICRWASPKITLIKSLVPLVQHIPGLASKLLPSIVHVLLFKELRQVPILRSELSAAMMTCFSGAASPSMPRERFFLQLLLYLRSQPYPKETTRVDRLRWLDVEYLSAAKAGSRCGMPTSSLLLAESGVSAIQNSRRTSARASLSQLEVPTPPQELLLALYTQIEEPDSFYGVEQPASLDSVLRRLDHEADGYRSLMFRSAQMDTRMRRFHRVLDEDAAGMVQSLTALNLNSLAFTMLQNGLCDSTQSTSQLMSTARMLQQWDVTICQPNAGDSAVTFALFKDLSRADELVHFLSKLHSVVVHHMRAGVALARTTPLPHSWSGALATLTEVSDMVRCADESNMISRWGVLRNRDQWMHMARFEEVNTILANRQTLFGVLSQNRVLRERLQVSPKQSRMFEVEALLDSSRLSREHSRLQEALAAVASLNDMGDILHAADLKVEAAVKFETASVLWAAEEASASVRMLRNVLATDMTAKQDIGIGYAGLLAQLGHQLGNARLAKPDEILQDCLRPAIEQLKGRKDGREAGKVHYEFATFCDKELQNPGNIESLSRIVKLRQGKEEELDAIRQEIRKGKKIRNDGENLMKSWETAQRWLKIDKDEEHRLSTTRKSYVKQSLQNYLLALGASDEHNICILRFFALWLENSNDQSANDAVKDYLSNVPAWKFVLLMNQLMSRIEAEGSTFQHALRELLVRICLQHPHHSIHHLYAASRKPSSEADPAAASRFKAAMQIYEQLSKDKQRMELIGRIWTADSLYKVLAETRLRDTDKDKAGNFHVTRFEPAARVQRKVPGLHLPPVTMSLPLLPSGDYSNIPTVQQYESRGSTMSGLSAPKRITCRASDGQEYKQLFKSGNDDLRQDAIMEQVFEEVSKMLRNHKATRQRDLKVRTYKVIPLTNRSGIIEFVSNSLPLNDYLRPAHKKYHPKDWPNDKARELIAAAKDGSIDHRVKEFKKVCEHVHPVLRHFFFEQFDDADDWFKKRTAYTRTTASISILGHILGLGDRHNSNILLDKGTGEVVHIDLGVAFEAGRVLPIPELVPFRLTRDIIDGMGSTGVEGIFRRCCEFTLDAVRDDQDSIMTLLNVLRYDPLYSWSVSPLRAKRMQEAQQTGRTTGTEGDASSRTGQDDGEADRALSVVEKKLSKALSVAAAVNELIQQATDERNLATLFYGWAAYW